MAPTIRWNSFRSDVEPLSALGGDGVVARAAVVLRRAPFRADPAVEQQPLQRRIQRALADLQHIGGQQADAVGDAVAVLRAARQRPQDQQVERARQQIRRLIR